MTLVRTFSFCLLGILTSGVPVFAACEQVLPSLQMCRSRGEFYRAALAAGVTTLGVETFEDQTRTPAGQYPFIREPNATEHNATLSADGEGSLGFFFVQSQVSGYALASKPGFVIRISFDIPVRAFALDFVKPHPEGVRINGGFNLGALPSGFIGFVATSAVLQSFSIDNFTTPGEVVSFDNIEYPGGPASSQVNPQPPITCPSSIQRGMCYVTTLEPAWYDPPTTVGYRLTALEGRFTAINDFPSGFSAPFTVRADGAPLGQFGPGQPVTFPGGATELTIGGITPAVDGSSPLAFPIKLSLDSPGATFVMLPLTLQDIDDAPPEVACGTPDGLWHAEDVSIACTASDTGSGLANGNDASFSLSTNVTGGTESNDAQTASRSVCDAKGNCVTAGPVGGNRVDKRPPTITVVAPASGAYAYGQSVIASFQCTDAGSGVSTCAGTAAHGNPIDTSTAGSKTFTVVSKDLAGNGAETSIPYTVGDAPRLTGSGYNSPETPAYRATFSVNVGGPSVTAGSIQYSYSRTRMVFGSSRITSLSVTGSGLTVEGEGTVGGVSGYTFTATAVDGSPDAFGIVIRRADGTVYFTAATLPLAGGIFTLLR
jgi:hypothetical protein